MHIIYQPIVLTYKSKYPHDKVYTLYSNLEKNYTKRK